MTPDPLPYATAVKRPGDRRLAVALAALAIALLAVAGLMLVRVAARPMPMPVLVSTMPTKVAVDDTAHLQALLAPFVADPTSKIEPLPAGITRAMARGHKGPVALTVKQVDGKIVDVLVTAADVDPLAISEVDPISAMVGDAGWRDWIARQNARRDPSDTIGEWTIEDPMPPPYRLHVSRAR